MNTLFRRRPQPDPEPVEPPNTDPIPLPVDENGNELAVPCRTCGIAVPGSATERRDYDLPTGRVWTQGFARCGPCGALRARAEQFVAATPGLAGRYGSIVTDLLESSQVALNVLNRPVPEQAERADIERWLKFLTPAGSSVQWMTRATDAPGYSHPFPFSYLTDDDLAGVRAGYAEVLAERLAANTPPVVVTPPPIDPDFIRRGDHAIPDGCLMCGVGRLAVPVMAQNPWTLFPGGIGPHQLGGRRSPTSLRGYACPNCQAAVNRVGSVGPTAMERSLVVALGVEKSWRPGASLNGVSGGVDWSGTRCARSSRRLRRTPSPGDISATWTSYATASTWGSWDD